MPTATFYPSLDGRVNQQYTNETFANLRNGPGSGASHTETGQFLCNILAGTSSGRWNQLDRGIFLFDTSSLPDNAIISSAIFSIYGYNKAKTGMASADPRVNIYSSAPASDTELAAGDYDSLGVTPFSTAIAYADFNIAGYNDFVLNANGLAVISKTGKTKLGTRESNHDVANQAPSPWGSSNYVYMQGYFAEQGGVYRPKLVITYIVIAPTDPLTRVSSITRTFWAGAPGQGGVYQVQLTTGGVSALYVPPIASREVVSSAGEKSPPPAGLGYQVADYQAWLSSFPSYQPILMIFGHMPSYNDWLEYKRRGLL